MVAFFPEDIPVIVAPITFKDSILAHERPMVSIITIAGLPEIKGVQRTEDISKVPPRLSAVAVV